MITPIIVNYNRPDPDTLKLFPNAIVCTECDYEVPNKLIYPVETEGSGLPAKLNWLVRKFPDQWVLIMDDDFKEVFEIITVNREIKSGPRKGSIGDIREKHSIMGDRFIELCEKAIKDNPNAWGFADNIYAYAGTSKTEYSNATTILQARLLNTGILLKNDLNYPKEKISQEDNIIVMEAYLKGLPKPVRINNITHLVADPCAKKINKNSQTVIHLDHNLTKDYIISHYGEKYLFYTDGAQYPWSIDVAKWFADNKPKPKVGFSFG
jgi:hypothetical protein